MSTPDYRVFKIGSSKHPRARLEEWTRQCPSHRAVFLGCEPPDEGGREGVRGRLKVERGSLPSFLEMPAADQAGWEQGLFRLRSPTLLTGGRGGSARTAGCVPSASSDFRSRCLC